MKIEIEKFFSMAFDTMAQEESVRHTAGYQELLQMYNKAKKENWSISKVKQKTAFTHPDICGALGHQTLDQFWSETLDKPHPVKVRKQRKFPPTEIMSTAFKKAMDK